MGKMGSPLPARPVKPYGDSARCAVDVSAIVVLTTEQASQRVNPIIVVFEIAPNTVIVASGYAGSLGRNIVNVSP